VLEVTILDEQNIRFTYIPTHLHYMLLEVLKNSMRATCEYHKGVEESKLPPIEAIIVRSSASSEVIIKLCDQGGGISKDTLDKIWLYSYSTMPPKDANKNATPMAGLGYGLPLARLHARYFGGHLGVVSMHGYELEYTCFFFKKKKKKLYFKILQTSFVLFIHLSFYIVRIEKKKFENVFFFAFLFKLRKINLNKDSF
ncbi:pyruvate dehydrogenase kinase, partial [Reticulomyxa filosa]